MISSIGSRQSAWSELESQRLRRKQAAQEALSAGESAANGLIGASGESPQVTQALQVANARIQKQLRERQIKAAREAGQNVPDRQTNLEKAELTQKTNDARQRAILRTSKLA